MALLNQPIPLNIKRDYMMNSIRIKQFLKTRVHSTSRVVHNATLGTWHSTSYCSLLRALSPEQMKHAVRKRWMKFVLLMCLIAVALVAFKLFCHGLDMHAAWPRRAGPRTCEQKSSAAYLPHSVKPGPYKTNLTDQTSPLLV